MSDLRSISIEGFEPPAATSPGPAPMMDWLPIAKLRVDGAYQREILGTGRRTIKRIVEAFDWSKFAAVVVAPIEGGFYSIVDGQHRTTAAAICGFETVPCYVVQADRAKQAAAFAAINGTVTAISAMQVHWAKVAAGDPAALELNRICEAADVRILRSTRHSSDMKAGQTLAAGALTRLAASTPADILIRALQCITQTGEGNPGMLRPGLIRAFVDVLIVNPEWGERASELFDVVENHVDLETLAEQGTGLAFPLLQAALEKHMRREA